MSANFVHLDDLVRAVDGSRSEPLARLALAVEVSREIDVVGNELVGHYVDAARSMGLAWAQIGDVFGVTKQAAQQRFTTREALPTARMPDGLLARFTDKARRAMRAAEVEARRRGHNYVGTEHILASLVTDPEALSTKVLESLGIGPDTLRTAITRAVADGQSGSGGALPFTSRAIRVLELAPKEAVRLTHNYIGTEHILLAVGAEGEGIGARVLTELGADQERIRSQVVFWLSGFRAGRTK